MRHKHRLSHYKLLTGDMGKLYPIGLVEVLPKDTFQHSTSVFMRFSPMAAPVMHPITVRVHHFYVPHRLTWPETADSGFESFITGGEGGIDVQTVPTIGTTGAANDLMDYFNVPVVAGNEISALPIRAFNQIFNEYYRDEDLVTKRLESDVTIPAIAWEKDYLTTARPFSQKGPAVTLPLGNFAPVLPTTVNASGDGIPTFVGASGGAVETPLRTDGVTNEVHLNASSTSADSLGWQDPQLYADLRNAQGVDINEFRKAFALQRFAEARSRYGSRYTEYLRYLGVNPSDARIQRPEYLGGGKVRVSISEVLQTSHEATPDRFGVGDMYGHGVAHTRTNAYRRTFEEHGYVVSLLSVRPKAMYLNGLSRTWLRRDREEFWQKELEQIGQQEVWDGEVFLTDDGVNHTVFGYQDRYREYREEPNRVSSEFKDVLKYWHLGRDFDDLPTLNASFVECDPSKRIFNEQTQHSLWIAIQHNLVARRLVSRNATSRIM